MNNFILFIDFLLGKCNFNIFLQTFDLKKFFIIYIAVFIFAYFIFWTMSDYSEDLYIVLAAIIPALYIGLFPYFVILWAIVSTAPILWITGDLIAKNGGIISLILSGILWIGAIVLIGVTIIKVTLNENKAPATD